MPSPQAESSRTHLGERLRADCPGAATGLTEKSAGRLPCRASQDYVSIHLSQPVLPFVQAAALLGLLHESPCLAVCKSHADLSQSLKCWPLVRPLVSCGVRTHYGTTQLHPLERLLKSRFPGPNPGGQTEQGWVEPGNRDWGPAPQ